jgi:hypothetical protein
LEGAVRLAKATYRLVSGEDLEVEYDRDAPCAICEQPVEDASVGGTAVCPACDMGKCRSCGVTLMAFKEELDGGRSLRQLREHVAHCLQWRVAARLSGSPEGYPLWESPEPKQGGDSSLDSDRG